MEGRGTGRGLGILSMHVEGLTLSAYNKKRGKKGMASILFNYFLLLLLLFVTVNNDLRHSLSFFFSLLISQIKTKLRH